MGGDIGLLSLTAGLRPKRLVIVCSKLIMISCIITFAFIQIAFVSGLSYSTVFVWNSLYIAAKFR